MPLTRMFPKSLLRPARTYGLSICARRLYSKSARDPSVAVLFQDIDPPVIGGVCKPRKPGGM